MSEIRVVRKSGEVSISYECVRMYHTDGNYAMLAAIFQGVKGALMHLSTGPIHIDEITILSGHPGTGVRDAFEFVTRSLTRGVYTVDVTLPYARFNPHKEMAYYFELYTKEKKVCAIMKDHILPARFFDLFGLAKSNQMSVTDAEEFAILKETIEHKLLMQDPNDIFTFEVK